ncbi:NYN domain-containing protein [Mesorhizobium sp.]|uniref:NYN domain-containing protein n=1 Tax=Mesorhizobium sp. TaxID=1871066 RepID=UPI00345D21B1
MTVADGLFEEIANIGEASVRRIYGDFSSARSKGWAETLSKLRSSPAAIRLHDGQERFRHDPGDRRMDLLHSGRLDGVRLVSSDSDFTRLPPEFASGVSTYLGSVNKRSPEGFRQACPFHLHGELTVTAPPDSQDTTSAAKPLKSPNATRRS